MRRTPSIRRMKPVERISATQVRHFWLSRMQTTQIPCEMTQATLYGVPTVPNAMQHPQTTRYDDHDIHMGWNLYGIVVMFLFANHGNFLLSNFRSCVSNSINESISPSAINLFISDIDLFIIVSKHRLHYHRITALSTHSSINQSIHRSMSNSCLKPATDNITGTNPMNTSMPPANATTLATHAPCTMHHAPCTMHHAGSLLDAASASLCLESQAQHDS